MSVDDDASTSAHDAMMAELTIVMNESLVNAQPHNEQLRAAAIQANASSAMLIQEHAQNVQLAQIKELQQARGAATSSLEQAAIAARGGLPLSKQSKRQLRHEQLMAKLNLSHRNLRKSQTIKTHGVMGTMDELDGALPSLSVGAALSATSSIQQRDGKALVQNATKRVNSRKGRNLTALRELQKMSAVLKHPAFQSNPFGAIQQHVSNSMAAVEAAAAPAPQPPQPQRRAAAQPAGRTSSASTSTTVRKAKARQAMES
ncbi:hypothetical protein CAOG_000088 [Capsaspora owczarzaki ATCC 30864]|uniref:Ribosome biogenesis protein SLX9 n=2 Tax=Capsaspora owczarzaki (strain ATCC 30864) TaxID=595528 RepID=A0A0D2X047_CAPO3|nr:hypothetical protein CAOG_000088 [Capsaspora owczarzaki ATCC 30864]